MIHPPRHPPGFTPIPSQPSEAPLSLPVSFLGGGTHPSTEPISAYFKLEFPGFSYYLQTLSVSIGRRTLPPNPPPPPPLPPSPPSSTASSVIAPPPPSSISTPTPAAPSPSASIEQDANQGIDVDLGAIKSVSRLHARISYDDESGCFVLDVFGRNGAWVEDEYFAKGQRAVLGERTKIQISIRTFTFILPPSPASQPAMLDHSLAPTYTQDSGAFSPATYALLESIAENPENTFIDELDELDVGTTHKGKGKASGGKASGGKGKASTSGKATSGRASGGKGGKASGGKINGGGKAPSSVRPPVHHGGGKASHHAVGPPQERTKRSSKKRRSGHHRESDGSSSDSSGSASPSGSSSSASSANASSRFSRSSSGSSSHSSSSGSSSSEDDRPAAQTVHLKTSTKTSRPRVAAKTPHLAGPSSFSTIPSSSTVRSRPLPPPVPITAVAPLPPPPPPLPRPPTKMAKGKPKTKVSKKTGLAAASGANEAPVVLPAPPALSVPLSSIPSESSLLLPPTPKPGQSSKAATLPLSNAFLTKGKGKAGPELNHFPEKATPVGIPPVSVLSAASSAPLGGVSSAPTPSKVASKKPAEKKNLTPKVPRTSTGSKPARSAGETLIKPPLPPPIPPSSTGLALPRPSVIHSTPSSTPLPPSTPNTPILVDTPSPAKPTMLGPTSRPISGGTATPTTTVPGRAPPNPLARTNPVGPGGVIRSVGGSVSTPTQASASRPMASTPSMPSLPMKLTPSSSTPARQNGPLSTAGTSPYTGVPRPAPPRPSPHPLSGSSLAGSTARPISALGSKPPIPNAATLRQAIRPSTPSSTISPSITTGPNYRPQVPLTSAEILGASASHRPNALPSRASPQMPLSSASILSQQAALLHHHQIHYGSTGGPSAFQSPSPTASSVSPPTLIRRTNTQANSNLALPPTRPLHANPLSALIPMGQTTEEGEAAKPPLTYNTAILLSLQSFEGNQGTLRMICDWIMNEFEWYRVNKNSGWQNSLRHTLSTNEAFQKVPLRPDQPKNAGAYWKLDPACEGALMATAESEIKNRVLKQEKMRKAKEKELGKEGKPPLAVPDGYPSRLAGKPVSVGENGLHRPLPVSSSFGNPAGRPLATGRPPATGAPVNGGRTLTISPNTRLPLLISPIPAHLQTTPPHRLLESTPMAMYQGSLLLDPAIFSHVARSQLDYLESLGQEKALKILRAYIVDHLKAKLDAQGKGGAPSTGVVRPGGTAVGPTGRPPPARPPVGGGTVRPASTPLTVSRPPLSVRPAVGRPVAVRPTLVRPPVGASGRPPPVGGPSKPLVQPRPAVPLPCVPADPRAALAAYAANPQLGLAGLGPHAGAFFQYLGSIGDKADLNVAAQLIKTGRASGVPLYVPPYLQAKSAAPRPGGVAPMATGGPAPGAGVVRPPVRPVRPPTVGVRAPTPVRPPPPITAMPVASPVVPQPTQLASKAPVKGLAPAGSNYVPSLDDLAAVLSMSPEGPTPSPRPVETAATLPAPPPLAPTPIAKEENEVVVVGEKRKAEEEPVGKSEDKKVKVDEQT